MSKQGRIPVRKEELRARLREQVKFIAKSAADYDRGEASEARRLALHLRILFHQTRTSHALLQQLGMRDGVSFLNTCGPMKPTNLMLEHPMVMLSFGGVHGYAARLGADTPGFKPRNILFSDWWNKPVIQHFPKKVSFCRRDLVLAVADQDGGAHVDPEIDEQYARLSRFNEFGWQAILPGGFEDVEGIELAHIRQIAYEVLTTLETKAPYAMPSPG